MGAPPFDGQELRARAYLRAHQARPFGHDTPEEADMTAPPPPEEPRWWETGGPVDEQQPAPPVPPADQGSGAPGVHVHIVPPTPPAPAVDPAAADRQRRARRWVAAHGAAAFTGWTFGLYDAITHGLLEPAGRGATPAGLALAAFAYAGAEFVGERYGRILPRRWRPALLWVLRIPMATALLATALHAPNAHI